MFAPSARHSSFSELRLQWSPVMSEEPTHYLCCRSHGDHSLFVVCYADRFFEDVPADVRNRGPWRGERGEVVRLKPELRMALAEARYVVINCADSAFEPEVRAGPPQ